jgi:hypothetical protein
MPLLLDLGQRRWGQQLRPQQRVVQPLLLQLLLLLPR